MGNQQLHGVLSLTIIAMCVDLVDVLQGLSILLEGVDGRLILELIRRTDSGVG